MAKTLQPSLTGGEISPSLHGRTDLAKFATALAGCFNFFIRPTGGASNRAGLEFVYALDPASKAALIPFVFSTEQSYMLVFQEGSIKVYSQGAYIENVAPIAISSITPIDPFYVITTATPHGLSYNDPVTVTGVTGTGKYPSLNRDWIVASVGSPTEFVVSTFDLTPFSGAYGGGGMVTVPFALTNPYLSDDLADLRYTQSADVVTVVHQFTTQQEFVRLSSATFTFGPITDFTGGPFLDDNTTATTVTANANTGLVTLTASSPIFNSGHIGSLFRLSMQDFAAIPPWEPNKFIAASTVNPNGQLRTSNGKVYIAAGNAAAPTAGTYTGSVAPAHEIGSRSDGDGNLLNGTANTRAGVTWQFLHPGFGTARITAVGGGGTTATATVLDYLPIASPAVSTIWAFGAWSEVQGYPALATYFGDRLVFANTPKQPQTEFASKVGDYHNFARSSPLVANDAIKQTLNARQVNAILELVPMDQLIALTSTSSWASPSRSTVWTPTTIGFDPQSFDGSAFLRAIVTGDSALFAQFGGTKLRDINFQNDAGKFVGNELTVMARHLFDAEHYMVDMDYAKEPHGILWVIRSDGALIGLTYLPEQQVVGWHRHDTDGFFERVCVIPESGVDTPYFVVRREVNGQTVRYLERMAVRDRSDILDSFFVDSGLSYDGRNTTSTTIAISAASFDGGQNATLTASAAIFSTDDVGDAIQFPNSVANVRAKIAGFTSSTVVTVLLQSPVPEGLQNVETETWTFARDTFSGLGHLEGKTVAILADGCPEVQQTVVNGTVMLAQPAGVVHIGLPYISELETLDVTIFGAAESVSDNSKNISKVAVRVEKTLGMKAGADAANLSDFGLQPADFDYNAPWPLQTEIQEGFVVSSWQKSGHVLIRQDNPLPCTVLTITPDFQVGNNTGGQK